MRLLQVPVTFIATTIVLMAGSSWSQQLAHAPQTLKASVFTTLRKVVLLSLGVTAVAVVATFFLKGVLLRQLHLVATTPLGAMLYFAALSIPAFVISAWGVRFCTSTKSTRVLPYFALIAITLNVVADAVGSHFFGLKGLVLSTTLVRTTMAMFMIGWVYRTTSAFLQEE
jgi:hypothetical protein